MQTGTWYILSLLGFLHSTTFFLFFLTDQRATWGYGMVGYLLSRAGAARLIAGAQRGFAGPIDGHVWQHRIYTMPTDWVTHYACTHPCPRSIRTYLNGELPEGYAQPD